MSAAMSAARHAEITSGSLSPTRALKRKSGMTASCPLAPRALAAAGYVKNKDKLQFTPIAGIPIKGSFNVKTGTLGLKGTTSPANYQTVLESIKYDNLSPAPIDGVRTIAITVQDASGVGQPGIKLLRAIGVNSKPVETLTGPAISYKTRGTAMAFASTLKIKDIDNTRLQGAKVSFAAGFQVGDILTWSTTTAAKAGITVVFTPGTGDLVLTGNATLANYLALLKSVKFTTPTGTPAGDRTLSITVNDGLADSDPVTRVVTVV
jgi:hypothetical protein